VQGISAVIKSILFSFTILHSHSPELRQLKFTLSMEVITTSYHLIVQNKNAFYLTSKPYRRLPLSSDDDPRCLPCPSLLRRSCSPTVERSPVPPSQRERYSASPFTPRAAKGPHQNQKKSLASQLALTAELPLPKHS